LESTTSIVSASMCDGRGLRARITAFGETLIVKPSAYYLDLATDKLAKHTLESELLVYRLSDFDRPETMDADGVVFTDDLEQYTNGDVANNDERRRMYSSWDPAETEMAVVIGPVRTANYKYDYEDNWYSQLYQDTADLVNAVDDIYAATNWNANGRNSIGGQNAVRIIFSEIHVIHEFSGNYYSLRPPKRTPDDCGVGDGEYDDSDYCSVIGNQWLSDIRSWVGNHMSTSNYDNVQFITDIKFNWEGCPWYAGLWNVCSRTLGWGGIGTMCKGSSSVSVDSFAEDFGGNENLVGTVAHELGHNFGLYHDGQSGPASSCGAEDGLMGYGSTKDRFSTCSLDGMEDYFNGWGYGMSCLNSGWNNDFVSNVNSNGQANTQETCPGFDCIYITGYNNNWENHEGYYSPSGSCHDEHRVYVGPNDEYLCYSSGMNRWLLTYTECENPFAMSSTTGGDVTTASYWMISYRGSFYSTPDMYVSNCDGNQAFNEDSTCLDDNLMDDEICISAQSDAFNSIPLLNSDRTFRIFDELCMNDQPVYHFVQRNDSNLVEIDDADGNETFIVEEVEEMTFYVHYQLLEGLPGMWMLSKDEISTNYLAFCQQEDLEDCTGNNWYVQTLFASESEGTSTNKTSGDGYIADVIDEFMTISNGHCDSRLSTEEGVTSKNGGKATMIVLVVVCVVMLLMLICAAPFCVRKWLEVRGNGKKEAVSDMEEDVNDPEPENVQSLEVEVEVNLSKDHTDSNGEAITTTMD